MRFISTKTILNLFIGFSILFASHTLLAKESHNICINLSSKSLNQRAKPYHKSIKKHAKRYGVDENLVKAIMAVESCYNRTALSPKDAQGLMQLLPQTAARFGVSDSYNPDQNIRGGTHYLKVLNRRYKGNMIKAIAAYNAGEGAVDKYKGVPPYKETQRYVKKVLHVYAKLSGRKVAKLSFADSNIRYNKKGRVSASYRSPFALGKPGRGGLAVNKLKAPHLYKH